MLSALELLPAPFAWAYIRAGKVSLIELGGYVKTIKGYKVPAFQMAEYPLTNAQYRLFVDSGGYETEKYWTPAGWQTRIQENWTQPLYWNDEKWNGADYPVVGVSWYEAIAYCRWLSNMTGEGITLPTEQAWQYVAEGDEGCEYPWGNGWDSAKCNHNVGGNPIGKTTPVRHYDGLGDSPLGVVDLVGNVWEWCSTIWESGLTDLDETGERILRGCSWKVGDSEYFRVWKRNSLNPRYRNDDIGFRLACFY